MKNSLEIQLKEDNAFEVQQYLQRFKAVTKVYSVTLSCIRVYYDENKIEPKKILKLIQKATKPEGKRERRKNIKSIHSVIEDESPKAA
jgi:hypothetical protein